MARPKKGTGGKRGRPSNAERAARAAAGEKPETKASATSSQSSGAAQGFKKPTAAQVVNLVRRLESMAGEGRGITAQMGEMTAKAVENQHFDKKALSIARSLYRLAKNNPQKFAITFPHLLAYCDDLELNKLYTEARGGELEVDEDQGGDGDDGGEPAETEQTPPAEQPATGASPRLQVVPGSAAPAAETEPPPAPAAESDQAA
jgi:hypothetical protein